jgi:hypothetical protein
MVVSATEYRYVLCLKSSKKIVLGLYRQVCSVFFFDEIAQVTTLLDMKSKVINPLLYLATSVLLFSAVNKASAGVVTQPSVNELQTLSFDLVNSDRTSITIPISKNSNTTIQPTPSTQAHSAIEKDQVSEPVGGLFVTSVFVVYILVGLRYRKHRTHRAALLLQQIETLERIWNMQSHR